MLKTNQKPKVNTKGGVIYIIRALNSTESLYKLGNKLFFYKNNFNLKNLKDFVR